MTVEPHATVDSLESFQHLMPYRVQDILLVSSLYDSFILQQDGRLNELILGEFLELSLHQSPGITHVSTGAEALALARAERRFNLVITTLDPADMDAAQLARDIREAGLDVPVVVLAYDNQQRKNFIARHGAAAVDRVFLWQGNARILVAIVKNVEDERNVEHDTRTVGVPVILVVEDNVRYYSSFLPELYGELIRHSGRLITEGINLSHKLVRLRARPKILLATTYEEARDLVERYRPYLLGLISDVEFPRDGTLSREAGFDLARMARALVPDLPIVLQSSREEFAPGARAVGASFLRKYSETLLQDLRAFMSDNFAFGDFVFRTPDGDEVARAHDLKELEEKLRVVPAPIIAYHGERNHFSNWLTARTEFALARRLKPRTVDEYASLEDLRHDMVAAIADYRREQSESHVADFDRHAFDPHGGFFERIGGGSLGGKARGLAFVRYMLGYNALGRRFPDVHINVPPAVVLATDCFERFLAENDLLEFALHAQDEGGLVRRFLEAPLPFEVVEDLAAFLDAVRWPLAVRSSSLLEDSQYQPFTGVYETFMLPNNDPDPRDRLAHLMQAVKRIYASTFSAQARAYLRATPFRLEEERMAVIVQRVVGAAHGDRYYPDFSGVARSHNFYPVEPLQSQDGVASVALGMGRMVVEGGKTLMFSPRHPQHLPQFSTLNDVLVHSQREFWALEMAARDPDDEEASMRETRFGLGVAEADGTLDAVCSTYSHENQAVYDGIARAGVRLVTFAPVLKHGVFPLAGILEGLLEAGSHGMNRPAEIEFAARLATQPGERHEFGFLQMRPLVMSPEAMDLDLDGLDPAMVLCRSPRVLGNGTVALHDVVVVDFHRFDRARSQDAAVEIARFNAGLMAEHRPYLLAGVGRWGSTDPWLGIPVTWDQIAGARVIVESGFRDFVVTPSQGSHFFQNLTSFGVGYFTVNADVGEGFVDWDWLAAQPAAGERAFVRHLRFAEPLVVRMNGRTHEGVVLKPGIGEERLAP